MKKVGKALGQKLLLVVTILVMSNCWAQSSSLDIYANALQEELKSQTWKDAVENEVSNTTSEEYYFYASNDNDVLEIDDTKKISPNSDFDLKYESLARRAYLKIIAQAEQADTRLEKEYILRNAAALKKGKKRSLEFERKLNLVNKRYHAHRKMLEGLKSWNIFSEFGTNDLDFFKAENKVAVKEMLRKGKNESSIVNFLIYKLADLYHFES